MQGSHPTLPCGTATAGGQLVGIDWRGGSRSIHYKNQSQCTINAIVSAVDGDTKDDAVDGDTKDIVHHIGTVPHVCCY